MNHIISLLFINIMINGQFHVVIRAHVNNVFITEYETQVDIKNNKPRILYSYISPVVKNLVKARESHLPGFKADFLAKLQEAADNAYDLISADPEGLLDNQVNTYGFGELLHDLKDHGFKGEMSTN